MRWFLTFFLVSCSVGPNYKTPEVPKIESFPSNDQYQSEGEVITDWWSAFDDKKLSELISHSIENNLDLEVAKARLKEARALRTDAILEFLPRIQGQSSYTRAKLSDIRSPNVSREQSEVYSLGAQATWELDLWGGVRRGYEASDATVESAEANLEDIRSLIIAEVARSYFEYLGASEELRVAKENALRQRETVRLTEALLDAGSVTEFDTSRAISQAAQTESVIPVLELQKTQSYNLLCALLGKAPGETELDDTNEIPKLKTDIVIRSPESLIKNRPDIRAVERSLAASSALVGVAASNYFPRIFFDGTFTLQARTPKGWDQSGAESFSFGPSISWAFLDMGRVISGHQAAKARFEAALAGYKRTVVEALAEIDSALKNFSSSRKQRILLEKGVNANKRAIEIARARYEAGIEDFLSVLEVEKTALELERQYVRAKTGEAVSVALLHRALGSTSKTM